MHPKSYLFKWFLPVCMLSALSVPADAQLAQTVRVDVTAANAVAAKEQGMADAETTAFVQLLDEAAPALTSVQKETLAHQHAASCVSSVELFDEKLSSVRYRARVVMNFASDCVHSALETQGITTKLNANKVPKAKANAMPLILAMPATLLEGPVSAWDGDLYWSQAVETEAVNKQLNAHFPLRDLADEQNLPSLNLSQLNFAQVEKIAQHYSTDVVYVLAAQRLGGEEDGTLTIATYALTPFHNQSCATTEFARANYASKSEWYQAAAQGALDSATSCKNSTPPAAPSDAPITLGGETPAPKSISQAAAEAAAAQSAGQLAVQPGAAPELAPSVPAVAQPPLTVKIFFSSLAEWIRLSKTMNELASVKLFKLSVLEASQATAEVRLQSTLETFLNEIRALGLKITQISDQIVEIRVETQLE